VLLGANLLLRLVTSIVNGIWRSLRTLLGNGEITERKTAYVFTVAFENNFGDYAASSVASDL
jgi:hypothetical protein